MTNPRPAVIAIPCHLHAGPKPIGEKRRDKPACGPTCQGTCLLLPSKLGALRRLLPGPPLSPPQHWHVAIAVTPGGPGHP